MNQDNREELYKLLKKDPRADTYVIPQRVMDIIVEYTQKQSDIARQEGYKKGYIDGGIAAIVAQPETPEERKKRLSDHWEDL